MGRPVARRDGPLSRVRALAAFADALAKAIDLSRVQQREIEAMKAIVRRVEGVTFGDP